MDPSGRCYTPWFAAGTAVLALILVVLAYPIFFLTFASILLALFLSGLSEWVQKTTGLSYALSLALVVLLLLIGMLMAGGWLAPRLSDQFNVLVDELPRAWETIEKKLGGRFHLSRWILGSSSHPSDAGPKMVSTATTILSRLATGGGALLFVLFSGLFLAIEPHCYQKLMIRFVPGHYRSQTAPILADLARTLRRWLFAQLLVMGIMGFTTTVALMVLKMPLAILLGFLAGLLYFIPYIGAIVSSIPAILLALTHNLRLALMVTLVYVGLHIVEGYVITPIVQRKAIRLPPFLILFAQALLGTLVGVLGIALSTPLLAALLVLVNKIYGEERMPSKSRV